MPGNLYDEALETLQDRPAQGPTPPSPAAAPRVPLPDLYEEARRVVESRAETQGTRLRRSFLQSADVSPERAAEARRLSLQIGVPPAVLLRNWDLYTQRQAVEGQPYGAMQTQTPKTAAWLEDTGNAAVAKDDLESLGALEWLLTAPQRAFARGVAQVQYAQVAYASLFRPLTQAERDLASILKQDMTAGGALGAGESWFRKAVTGAAGQLPILFGAGLAGLKYGIPAAVTAGTGAALAGPLAPVTVPVAFSAGMTAGTTVGAGEFSYQLESTLAYDEYLQFTDDLGQPLDPDVAKAAALASGILNGGLEVVGLEVLVESIPGGKRLLGMMSRNAIKQALRSATVRTALKEAMVSFGKTLTAETAVEVGQRAVAILSGEVGKQVSGQAIPAKTPTEVASDLYEEAVGALQAFLLIAAPGPTLQATLGVREARRAQQNVAFFEALGQGVANSKTAQRAPEALQDLLTTVTEDGPIPDVYMPVGPWVAYWQEQGQDPDQVAAEVTGIPNALAQAVETSGDLRIPTAAYAARLAGTPHNAALAPQLRLGPNELNAVEAQAVLAAMAEQQAALEAAATQVAEPVAPTPAEQLRAQVTAQLEAAQVPRATAERYAALVEAGFGSLAERAALAGIDPLTLFREYGIAIERTTEARAEQPPSAPPAAPGAAPITPAGVVPPPAVTLPVEGAAAPVVTFGGMDLLSDIELEAMLDSANPENVAAAVAEVRRRHAAITAPAQTVVYDAAGQRRVLPPEQAATYRAQDGETVVAETRTGLRVVEDRGGRLPLTPPAAVAETAAGATQPGAVAVEPGAAGAVAPAGAAEAVAGPAAGPVLSDRARELVDAYAGGGAEGAGAGAGAAVRRLPAPGDYPLVAFEPADPDADAARLTPGVRRELTRIADELRELPFIQRVWSWLGAGERKTGTAAGGAADIIGGAPGAPVYDDVLQFSPLNKGAKGALARQVRGTRAQVETAVRRTLETGRISSNLAEGAVRVAEHREAGDYADLSPPSLPPSWGEVADEQFTDDLRAAIDAELDAGALEIPDEELSAAQLEAEATDEDIRFDVSEFGQSLIDLLQMAGGMDPGAAALATIRQHGYDIETYNEQTGVWELTDTRVSDDTRSRGGAIGRRAVPAPVTAALQMLNHLPVETVIALINAPPMADILPTGEVQPRLPGAEAVREQEVPTPTLEEVEARKQRLHDEIEDLDHELGHPFGDRDDFSSLMHTALEDVSEADLRAALEDLEALRRDRLRALIPEARPVVMGEEAEEEEGGFQGTLFQETEGLVTPPVAPLAPATVAALPPLDPALAPVVEAVTLQALVPQVQAAMAASPTGRLRLRPLKEFLQATVRAALERSGLQGPLDAARAEVQAFLTHVMTREVAAALAQAQSAVGWYHRKVYQARAVMSLPFPELARDRNAWFAFSYALAVTSNGLEAAKRNFELATIAYEHYRRTGLMPTNIGEGTAKAQIDEQLARFNTLKAEWGLDAFRTFMVTKTTVSAIKKLGFNVSGERATQEVYGAAMLGAKIGNGFFMNLNGVYSQLTMDRWYVRAWQRWLGRLIEARPEVVAKNRVEVQQALAALTPEARAAWSALIKMPLQDATYTYTDAELDTIAAAIGKVSERADKRAQMNATPEGVWLRKKGNTLDTNLAGEREGPKNPEERAQMRVVTAASLAALRAGGYTDLTIADEQAVLWYPEKRLYKAASDQEEVGSGYQDGEAPDYANAAVAVVRDRGFDERSIARALAAGRRRAADTARRAAAAQPVGGGAAGAGETGTAALPRGVRRVTLRQVGRRGAITIGPNRQITIRLFEKANLSTFLHEGWHLFFEVFGDLVDRINQLDPATLTDTQRRMLADYDILLKRLGVANRREIRREHHELVARMGEAYLMEGKAPSIELRPVFARFRAWFLGIYRTLRRLNAPLTDEVRGVFDRMLASDAAIAQAEAQGRLEPLFLTAEQAQMSPDRFALYTEAVAGAGQRARAELDTKLAAEVAREQTAVWKAQREDVRAQVEAVVHKQPVYQALAAMRRGTAPDGTPLEADQPPTPLRLSRRLIAERYGEARLKTLPPFISVKQDGLDPDAVAALFGFSSGDDLLTAVAVAPPMTTVIEQETDRRMLQSHGSILLDGTLMEQAQAASANEERETVLRAELRALLDLQRTTQPFVRAEQRTAAEQRRQAERERAYERRWFEAEAKLRIAIAEGRKQVEIDRLEDEVDRLHALARGGPAAIRRQLPTRQQVQTFVTERIAKTRVRDLRPSAFWATARRAAQEAVTAAARQDFTAAADAKRTEIVNLALYREAMRAQADVDRRVTRARELGKPATRKRLGFAGQNYLDQVDGILDRYEFAAVPLYVLERRAAMADFIAGLQGEGLPVELPAEVVNDARRINYKSVTVEELVGVTDGLEQILHLARLQTRLLKEAQQRTLDEQAQRMADSIREHARGVRKPPARDRRPTEERRRAIGDTFGSHRTLSFILNEMDGFEDGGPMWEAIMVPLNEAGAQKAERNALASRALAAIVERAFPRSAKNKLYDKQLIPAIGQSLSYMERLMVALNWGNEGNRERIRRYEKWTDQQVQAILDTLSASDLEFVQAVWDYYETYWPEIVAKQQRVTGLAPAKVQPVGFTAAGGTVRGGYHPLAYDDRVSARAQVDQELTSATLARHAAYVHATTNRGHVEARVASVNRPVRRDFGVIFEHVTRVIHDLTHHEALIDVGRLLGHRAVQEAIYEVYGDQAYKRIRNTIRDVAFDEVPAQNGVERAFNHVRVGSTLSALGWYVQSAFIQLAGLANAAVRIGPRWVVAGLVRWLRSPTTMVETVRWIYDRSVTMRTRGYTQQREINEIRATINWSTGKFAPWMDEILAKATADVVTRQGILDSYFWMIQQMQRIVDVITWLGAYEKAMAAGEADPARVIQLADQAVLDSQGAGQIKDLAEVRRGGPMLKLWTNFYTGGSITYNQTVQATKRARFNQPGSMGRLLSDYMMLFIMPAAAIYAIRAMLRPGEADDDDAVAWAIAMESLSLLFGTMVGLRELSSSVQGYAGYDGPAGANAFAAMGRLVRQVQQGEVDPALWKALADVGGPILHFPVNQTVRTMQGIMALAEGTTRNPVAVVSGPPKDED